METEILGPLFIIVFLGVPILIANILDWKRSMSSLEKIRKMNPGKDIPSGAEMAARLAKRSEPSNVCPACDGKDPLKQFCGFCNGSGSNCE